MTAEGQHRHEPANQPSIEPGRVIEHCSLAIISCLNFIDADPPRRDRQRDAMPTPLPNDATVLGACPHDCPDTCSMLVKVADGKVTDRKSVV